jgi:HNH endonuclease
MRRMARKLGKMRKRSATVERFDDIEILERDRWRCYICGANTPKYLRGSYEPNAPEVDHVVAIANGGAHARWNVRCACRACNGAKGARGQFSLAL